MDHDSINPHDSASAASMAHRFRVRYATRWSELAQRLQAVAATPNLRVTAAGGAREAAPTTAFEAAAPEESPQNS